jgi:hypothetical protein
MIVLWLELYQQRATHERWEEETNARFMARLSEILEKMPVALIQ